MDILVHKRFEGVLVKQSSNVNCIEVFLPELSLTLMSVYVEPGASLVGVGADRILRRGRGLCKARVLGGAIDHRGKSCWQL